MSLQTNVIDENSEIHEETKDVIEDDHHRRVEANDTKVTNVTNFWNENCY